MMIINFAKTYYVLGFTTKKVINFIKTVWSDLSDSSDNISRQPHNCCYILNLKS